MREGVIRVNNNVRKQVKRRRSKWIEKGDSKTTEIKRVRVYSWLNNIGVQSTY